MAVDLAVVQFAPNFIDIIQQIVSFEKVSESCLLDTKR